MGKLLLRGMLVGVLAGLLCFGFLQVFGEPQIERAIAFETQVNDAGNHAKAAGVEGALGTADEKEPELVSRSTQSGLGLLTGLMVYSAAFGGLFALAFAVVDGRLGEVGPRATAALLSGAGFIAIYLVPSLKFPANPPAVGSADTIGMRTGLYFAMIALSLAAFIGSVLLRRGLLPTHGAWTASLLAATVYLTAVVALGLLLPEVDEVPADFPAVVLWRFRVASIGAQFLMWAAIGLGFGALAEREARGVAGGGLRSRTR